MATVSYMQACREFFGVKTGQRPLEFGREVQALTQKDREEIAAGLVANGYEIDGATIAAAGSRLPAAV